MITRRELFKLLAISPLAMCMPSVKAVKGPIYCIIAPPNQSCFACFSVSDQRWHLWSEDGHDLGSLPDGRYVVQE